MKFNLSWLKDHLETDASVDEICEALTDLGLEVEGVENPAQSLAGFTLAKVKHAEQHPDADRLRVCTVETDEGDKQIVCGAPNARTNARRRHLAGHAFEDGVDDGCERALRALRR